MVKEYSITKEKREIYKGIIILNEMINNHRKFPVVGDSNIDMLKTLLTSMSAKNLVEIKNNEFIPTQLGRENLLNFYKKFWEYIKMFQIYSAVDLTAGSFAYSEYWNMDENKFLEYINQPNFDDVRIAVAEFKKIDPIEIVFMDFLSTNKIDVSSEDWAFQIMSDLVWSDIIEICENAIHVEELTDDDEIKDMDYCIIKSNDLNSVITCKKNSLSNRFLKYTNINVDSKAINALMFFDIESSWMRVKK
jgi:hypothetical protein